MQKEAQEIYQNFTEEEKEMKSQYHREHNKNLSEKQNELSGYERNYYITHNKLLLGHF